MQIIHTATELRQILNNQDNIAFVPTMGNLHAGHIRLVEIAKQHAKCVVVSIFVNPLQFGANEDLASYPRTLADDCEKLELAGAHILFAPSVEEMYPDFDGVNLNQTMTITPPLIANELCGASRPGHFTGVATVVMKLFNMVMPQVAIFGQKDFQQLFIIKQLVKQFNLPIQVIGVDTVREVNGLAMSSRNGYLSIEERNQASQLYETLQSIVTQIQNSSQLNHPIDFHQLKKIAISALENKGWIVDYVAIKSSVTLLDATVDDKHLVVLVAAKLGNTRLIDNIEFLRTPY